MLHHLFASWMQFVLDYGYFGVFVLMILESTAAPLAMSSTATARAARIDVRMNESYALRRACARRCIHVISA